MLAAALVTAFLLTACGARTEETPAPAPAEPEEMPASEESQPPGEAPRDMLPGLDVSALKATMPEADYEAFTAYLPVLRGEQTFRWVAGPYDGYPDYD